MTAQRPAAHSAHTAFTAENTSSLSLSLSLPRPLTIPPSFWFAIAKQKKHC